MMKKFLLSLSMVVSAFLLLIACQTSVYFPDLRLPFDPQIHKGQLANGLKYYIMPNKDPVDRVYIRLVVNAGSMNEDDDQKGVAHIVEHMAFNGTQKYPENQIIDVLEQLGMKFARDINAFTDFENTVYTLNLAKNDTPSLALALDVVDQWMNHLTILDKDLNAERGVVLEEWRARLSPMLRLGDRKSEIEMTSSRYVLRDPIGDVNIIKNVSQRRVNDFYKRWYRPDNMSLIVVGDIQADQIETLIQQKFSFIEKPTTTLPSIDFHIPIIEKWRVASLAEKELHTPSIELSFFQNAPTKNNVAEYKQDFLQQMVVHLLNVRLQQWEKQHTQVDSANFYHSYLGKQTMQSIFSLQLNSTDYDTQIKELFHFIAQITQQGFRKEEFDAEIKRLSQLNQRQLEINAGSLKLSNDLIAIAANDNISLGKQDRFQLNQQLLAQITLSDANDAFNQMIEQKARLLLVVQPYPAKALDINENKVEKWWNEVLNSAQTVWQQAQNPVKLPDLNLTADKIQREKTWQNAMTNLQVTEYQLANGSKLIYHYNDKSPNQIYFKALTRGGLRSIPESDYQLLRSAINVVDETGVGVVPQENIERIFSNNPIAFTTFIDDDWQGFTAGGKTAELGNLLKLFRLKLQHSPVSPEKLAKYKREMRQDFIDMDAETKFIRQIYQLRFPLQQTVYSRTNKQVQAFQQTQLEQAYQYYINGKTDFTYFIVGDIPQAQVEKLAKLYLASVDVKTQQRETQDIIAQSPVTPLLMKGLKEPRAEVEIYLTGNLQWQSQNEYQLDVIADVLQEKLRLALREKASGVYSVNTWFEQDAKKEQVVGHIGFSCAPERVNELIALSEKVLNEVKQNGIEPKLLAKKISEKHTQIQQSFDSLLVILGMLEQSYQLENSPELIWQAWQFEQQVDPIKLNQMAQQLLSQMKEFHAVLAP
ncbi:MAG: insulinase family protein [Pasteurellaceae bacterium]|nr:insulinase family protein [Pasteurellaceae bacterium]